MNLLDLEFFRTEEGQLLAGLISAKYGGRRGQRIRFTQEHFDFLLGFPGGDPATVNLLQNEIERLRGEGKLYKGTIWVRATNRRTLAEMIALGAFDVYIWHVGKDETKASHQLKQFARTEAGRVIRSYGHLHTLGLSGLTPPLDWNVDDPSDKTIRRWIKQGRELRRQSAEKKRQEKLKAAREYIRHRVSVRYRDSLKVGDRGYALIEANDLHMRLVRKNISVKETEEFIK